ncbi:MAG: carbohydrate-binding domain-containing protein [Bacteroidaceae bacterium]|nr:carbohydrate-binding domain-containing protein [Bacteroidaceae bacterium]
MRALYHFLLPTLLIACSAHSSGQDSGTGFNINEYDRTVRVEFSGSGVQVTGDTNNTVTVHGSHVTVNNKTDETVAYELSGTAHDGSVKLYSNRKQALVLDNLNLTNSTGAAINNQSKKECYVVIKGTNSLKDAASYTTTPSDEDEKAALFSEGELIICGKGTLNVTAAGKSGISSDDYVRITEEPVINVISAAGHGIRGKESVVIEGGAIGILVSADMKKGIISDSMVLITGGSTNISVTGAAALDTVNGEYKGTSGIKADRRFEITAGTLDIVCFGAGGKGISGDGTGCFSGGRVRVTTIGSNLGTTDRGRGFSSNSASAKGIKFDGNIVFQGGTVSVNSEAHEGIESKSDIIVKGGSVYSYSAADDAINSGGTFTIESGNVYGCSARNDGLDANGNFYIKGGLVYAIGSRVPEVAIDANTERGYRLYIQGGTLIAIGGLESGASLNQNCYQASSWTGNTLYSLTVGADVIAFRTPSSGGTPMVVSGASAPVLMAGVTTTDGAAIMEGMIITDASVSGGSQVSLSSYTGGSGGGFGPGGGGPGGRPGGW